MLLSTGFGAPGKDLVMSFMTYAYWAAMGGARLRDLKLPGKVERAG